jgi:hypothetical protein
MSDNRTVLDDHLSFILDIVDPCNEECWTVISQVKIALNCRCLVASLGLVLETFAFDFWSVPRSFLVEWNENNSVLNR